MVADLRRHIDQHRQLARDRETRIIELERQVDALERLRARRSVRAALAVAAATRPLHRAVTAARARWRARRQGFS